MQVELRYSSRTARKYFRWNSHFPAKAHSAILGAERISMSMQRVLDDWSDYDSRKSNAHVAVDEFNCLEAWEVNYLVDKVRKVFPTLAGVNIKRAILQCCRESNSHQRKAFVKSVLNRLGLFV